MSISTDLSFMDLFFDKEDQLINFDKDIKNDEMKFLDNKHMGAEDWPCGDDILDSLLQLGPDNHPFEVLQNDLFLEDEVLTLSSPESNESNAESSSCSDSGVSSDQQLSPVVQYVEEEEIEETVIDLCDEPTVEEEETVIKEEIVELDEPMLDVLEANDTNTQSMKEESIEINEEVPDEQVVTLNVSSPLPSSARKLPTVRVKPITNTAPRVIRVTPVQSNNPRSILIPVNVKSVNGVPGVRTIKIINATGKPFTNQASIGARAKQLLGKTTLFQKKIDDDKNSGSETSDEHEMVYPRLQLTPEEKRLMAKEGVTLPSHYPLTKSEERELKRIRRKIRNKISAQDSRKRKKEYVDGLEDRVKQCTEENLSLMKRLKVLQSQNQSLTTQLRRLQAAVARGTAQTAQPATCLMVLVLSLALVMAPNLRSRAINNKDLEIPESKNPLAGRSRTLLFSKPTDQSLLENSIEQSMLGNDAVSDRKILSDLQELLKFRNPYTKGGVGGDHDYIQTSVGKKRARTYIDTPIDDTWPPPKRPHITINEVFDLPINKSRPSPEESKKVIVQLAEEELF
uniref:BZIP domain-containing protein n=1 Tax=Clastoptera arizonana TaxID=38151 RepID=A0A1B6CCH6_9HEMI